jgi:hypothetical protein
MGAGDPELRHVVHLHDLILGDYLARAFITPPTITDTFDVDAVLEERVSFTADAIIGLTEYGSSFSMDALLLVPTPFSANVDALIWGDIIPLNARFAAVKVEYTSWALAKAWASAARWASVRPGSHPRPCAATRSRH